MERSAHNRRHRLPTSLLILGAVLLWSTPYLVAADGASGPEGVGIEGVRFSQVTLVSFTAVWDGSQTKIEWQTGIEIYNEGFNLYRTDRASSASMQVNGKLIPSRVIAEDSGAAYRFVDTEVAEGQYEYWLESIDSQGLPHYLGETSMQAAPDGPPYRLYMPSLHR